MNLTLECINFNDLYARKDDLYHQKTLPYFAVAQAYEGTYRFSIDGNPFEETEEGGIFITPPHAEQRIYHIPNPKTGNMRFRFVYIDCKLDGNLDIGEFIEFPKVLSKEQSKKLTPLLKTIIRNPGGEIYQVAQRTGAAFSILNYLIKEGRVKMEPIVYQKILPAMTYINDHLYKNIKVNDLASLCFMSTANFYHIFREVTGDTPINIINHRRIIRAAELLAVTELSIGEISSRVGISDQFYFSRLFKKYYNISPSEYRTAIKMW